MARAHPGPSHLEHPASDWLHTRHRRARRYRSTGCGRMSPAAGKGRRRSEPVRREEGPTRGTESHPQRLRWTKPPLPPQSRVRQSPRCTHSRPRSLRRPISLRDNSAELIGQLRSGSVCLRYLVARLPKPREAGWSGKG